ncbi:NrsF family protein [Ancylobacter lacus]|uniref:NrsF family protein n=1 Tax=Ancylobacter lacus TaxID=2579970 RepID=UPI001BCB6C97|nr:DUF1109 domain-containing protein [Ancylobacter lacus]
MKTDELIRGLARDERAGRAPETLLALLLPAGLLVSVLLFAGALHLRPELSRMLAEPRVLLKIGVSFALGAAACVLALRLCRPGADPRPAVALMLVPPVLLAAGVAGEMLVTPASGWMTALVGRNPRACLTFIPLLAAPLLVAALLALRQGAPANPARAGAVAGLMAAGFGASLYALHCPDDSPLFVLTWYSGATLIVTGLGAVLGRRVLAW